MAKKRSREAMPANARFVNASFDATTLASRSVSAVMSIDALYLAPDPRAALNEIRRVSIRGAPLVYSYYTTGVDRIHWPALTTQAGFGGVSVIDSSDEWRRYMRRKHSRRWRNRDAIRRRLGGWAEAELAVTRSMLGLDGVRSFIADTARHILVARRK